MVSDARRKDQEKLPRITFEEVLDAQLRLVADINKFIAEDRCLNDDEKDDFRKTYSRATLGKGGIARPMTNLPVLRQQTIDRILYKYLFNTGMNALRVGWDTEKERQDMRPKELWEMVLDRLNMDVFGAALQQAIVLSPEHDTRTRYGGVRPEME